MERATFIKNCGKLCLGSLFAASLLESCAGNYYAATSVSNNLIQLKKTEFIQLKNGVETYRKFVLIKADHLQFPICVYQINQTEYTALYMECTHKSCELTPHGDYLICPWHGSEFSNAGKVQNPPAEADLHNFKIKTDHENIYIYLA